MHTFNHWADFLCHWQPLMRVKQRGLLVVPECPDTYDKLIPLLLRNEVLNGDEISTLVVNIPTLVQGSSSPCLSKPKQSQLHLVNAVSMKRYLGQSHHLLLYKATDEFNVSVFSALCGCLSGGGLAVLIIPAGSTNRQKGGNSKGSQQTTEISHSNEYWSLIPDQQIHDYHSHYGESCQAPSYFKRWWQNQWHGYEGVMLVTEKAQAGIANHTLDEPYLLAPLNSSPTVVAKKEQIAFVAAVMALSQQKVGALCLSGARGRGKSTALALACKKMHHEGIPFVVTASASHGIRSLHQQWQELIQQDSLATENHFIALDYLLNHPLATDTLILIEEASTLPLAFIRQLLLRYEKVIFVNTIDGYEGTGQGIRIKLPGLLKHFHRPCQYIQFHKPLRWQPDDHLEAIINGCFLPPMPKNIPAAFRFDDTNTRATNTESVERLYSSVENLQDGSVAQSLGQVPQQSPNQCSNIKMHTIRGQALYLQPTLLKNIFALLQQAHYQTTSQDLRLLLDHPHLTIHYWHNPLSQLTAVVCSIFEGHIVPELSLDIARGKRRIKGHLLPQILIQQAGIAAMGELGFQRIQRIAVHPLWQRQGLGRQVLRDLKAYYEVNPAIDFIGASFAAEPDVVSFWLQNQFHPVWAGLRMDKASGLPSLQVLQPLTSMAKKMLLPLQQHWFFYHQYLQRYWNKHSANIFLTKQLLSQTQQTFQGYPICWLAELAEQTQYHSGNAYNLAGYLWQYLIVQPVLSSAEQAWLDAVFNQSLTHRQFVHQTKHLLTQVDVAQVYKKAVLLTDALWQH